MTTPSKEALIAQAAANEAAISMVNAYISNVKERRDLMFAFEKKATELRTQAASLPSQPEQEPEYGARLWLWKNFVDGKPEYWAFDNAYPAYANGDPMTLGSPCGYALFRPSTAKRPEVTDAEVLGEVRRVAALSEKQGALVSKQEAEDQFIEAMRQADWRLYGRQLTPEDYRRAMRALNFPEKPEQEPVA